MREVRGCYFHCSVPFICLGSICVTAIKGRPKSRTLLSKPCSAAWSITEPRITVVPSHSWVRLSPSNQAAHRVSRCPLRRISYWPSSRRVSGDTCVSLMCSFLPWLDHLIKGRKGCDEYASSHVMIDVTIRAIAAVAGFGLLLQKFFGPLYCGATVVHTELA